ncbi:hypothetical protein FDP41_003856 [Naegleria fowleri]|uniref:Uncharacterized protein n=1 Tax=Naegleria fowleri TaxID=5763 RepID=A0A6A5BH37_NAEFO|nr:uncharacterized protein FDP41_003856 [Naegleria fowleri]KAF0977203.1 hypothetical protein FDP41_003856 [Naegleria fowleri]CAG4719514.1 unnamed protein product [Naegleria fowleri]
MSNQQQTNSSGDYSSQFEQSINETVDELKSKMNLLEEKVKDVLQFADTLQQVEDLEFSECERLKIFSIINKQFPLDPPNSSSTINSTTSANLHQEEEGAQDGTGGNTNI